MIKQVLTITGFMLMTSAVAVAGTTNEKASHRMMQSGDGPQSTMMEGSQHPGQAGTDYRQEAVAEAQHYMMLPGDGPQGYMMPGAYHPGNQPEDSEATTASAEKQTPRPRHYMMNSGDGPQGYWMDGDQHHC